MLNPAIGIVLGTNGDKIAVDMVQFENIGTGEAASTPIPTTTVAVTRNMDALGFPSAGNALSSAGTAYAECTLIHLNAGSGRIIGSDVTTATAAPLLIDTTGQPRVFDGTTFGSSSLAVLVAGVTTKVASSWTGSAMKAFAAGLAGSAQVFDGSMNFATNLGIGTDATSGDTFGGTIKNVKIWTRALTDLQIAGL